MVSITWQHLQEYRLQNKLSNIFEDWKLNEPKIEEYLGNITNV